MSQLNVDNIRNRTGSNGGPNFPSGITVAVGQTAYIHGNLQVDGTETIINTETLNVADKTVGIGSTSNASNTTADGSGIEVFASSSQTGNNKTLTWGNTANSWEFGPNDVGLKIGTGVTANSSGVTVTGVVTATSFKGDGSQLSGIDATAIQTGNTSVQTVDTGSDGHVKMTTEGGERVRIGPAGQIGLGGANYGTSGQVLTSAGSGSAPSWSAIPPAGNTFTGIASGSLANNKTVMLCQDGKLMEIAASSSPASTPNSVNGQWFNTGAVRAPNTVWNPRDRVVYVVYMKSNGHIYVQRWSANTGTGAVTYQNETAINTNGSTGNESRLRACYDTTNNHLIVMYYAGSTGGWNYRIGTPSGTNNYDLSWSSETLIQSSAYYGACCWEPSTGRVVTIYRNDAGGLDDLFCRAGTVSGSSGSVTITWGTAVTLDGTNNVDGSARLDVAPTYDGRVIYSWTRTGGATYTGAATINSNNSVTYVSSVATLTSNGTTSNVAYNPIEGKGVVTYSDATDSNDGWSRLITLTGGSSSDNIVTLGSPVEFKNSSYERGTLSWNAATGSIWGRYQSNGGTGATWLHMANISGSTLTWTNAGQINGGSDSYGDQSASWNAADNSAANSYGFISIAVQRDGTNYGSLYTANVITTISNMNNQQSYVGFANQAYTNGQTATINTYGNIVNTLSGLSAGTVYFVQNNGSLGISEASFASGTFLSGTPVAGTALNATTLLIRDPTTRTT